MEEPLGIQLARQSIENGGGFYGFFFQIYLMEQDFQANFQRTRPGFIIPLPCHELSWQFDQALNH